MEERIQRQMDHLDRGMHLHSLLPDDCYWQAYEGNKTDTVTQIGRPSIPYLFIIVSDVLNRLMERQVDRGLFEGIRPKCGCSVIHHLFFADDSLFFIKTAAEKAMNLKGILEDRIVKH